MTLKVSAITLDGVALDLAKVVADLTIRHGRVDVFDDPTASSAQLSVLGVTKAFVKAFHTGAPLVVWADDVAFVTGPAPRFTGRITDGGLDVDQLTAIAVGNLSTLSQYTVGAVDWPAETWSARVRRIFAEANPANLCTNPGFEVNLIGWTGGSATLTRDTAEHHSGVAAGKFVSPGAAANEYVGYDCSPLTVGAAYVVTLWAKFPAGAQMYANLAVAGSPPFLFVGTGAWQKVTCPPVLGVDGGRVPLYIATWYAAAPQALTGWVDDVQIQKGQPLAELELVVPPADPMLAARPADPVALDQMLGDLAGMLGAAVCDRPDGRILVQPLSARTYAGKVALDPAEVAYAPAWVQTLPLSNIVHVEWVGGVETATDPAAVAIDGPRESTIKTDFTVQADAAKRAAERLGRTSTPRWNIPAAPILAGHNYPVGVLVELTSMPAASPFDPWAPVVEGWTDTVTVDRGVLTWDMDLALSDPIASGLTLPWNAVPAAEHWNTLPATLAWKDALTLDAL